MISVGFKTDKGLSRANNEDSVFVMPNHNLYIVADGVGGQNSGQVASRMAVGYMAQYANTDCIDDIPSGQPLMDYFREMFVGANDLVFKRACSEASNLGMATTAVLCYIRDNEAYFVNVGDSRAYLVRDESINQITRDHTRVRDLIELGSISPDDADNHPDKHKITRAVGGEPVVRPDFFKLDIYAGDTIILCTDGLYGMVEESDISKLARRYRTMHGLARALVDLANAQGGEDNVSVVCIRIQ